MKKCSDCEYYKQEIIASGYCLRYPPKVFPVPAQNQMTGEVSMGGVMLPVQVASDNFCGEYTRKFEVRDNP